MLWYRARREEVKKKVKCVLSVEEDPGPSPNALTPPSRGVLLHVGLERVISTARVDWEGLGGINIARGI